MGGHGRDIGLPGQHPPIHVSKIYETLGTVYLTTMFLWMMYRAKEDGLVILGFEHPWDHLHEDHQIFQFKTGLRRKKRRSKGSHVEDDHAQLTLKFCAQQGQQGALWTGRLSTSEGICVE
ncbi:unnamed protein product [Discosporangium mesarthrocarpum]